MIEFSNSKTFPKNKWNCRVTWFWVPNVRPYLDLIIFIFQFKNWLFLIKQEKHWKKLSFFTRYTVRKKVMICTSLLLIKVTCVQGTNVNQGINSFMIVLWRSPEIIFTYSTFDNIFVVAFRKIIIKLGACTRFYLGGGGSFCEIYFCPP